jgi:opacity protein-like surface antigen
MAGLCGLTLFTALPALYGQEGLYMEVDAGGQWTPNTRLETFFGESLFPGSEVEFDPGMRFGFNVGYEVTDWFAVEGETGVYASTIDSITGAIFIDDATYSNVPLLVNVRFQGPRNSVVSPFIGAGAGMSVATFGADNLIVGGTAMHGWQSTVVFAYQAFAGLNVRINDQMRIGVEYHYFGTTDPEWEAESTFGTGSDDMRFSATETHALSIAFNFRF